MNKIERAKSDPIEQIWHEIGQARTVMLGSPIETQHMQPMSPNVDSENKTVWFFSKTSSDLARACTQPGKAHMCLISDDQDYHACVRGMLEVCKSSAHIEQFWSPIVEAWFSGGKSDPDLTLLKFTPENAVVWASTDSAIKFGWEIAKANLSDGQPDVGISLHLNFSQHRSNENRGLS